MRGVLSAGTVPVVTMRLSGKLSYGHLSYLEWLIESAAECKLAVVLDLGQLVEIDQEALFFLMNGEGKEFRLDGCPSFIRQWMAHEAGLHRAA